MVEVPTYDELMWPTLQAVKRLGGSGTNSEILATVVAIEEFSEEIQNEPHVDGRQTRLEHRLGWAKSHLKKGGALNNSQRGVWSITDLGEKLQEEQMREFLREVRRDRRPISQRSPVAPDDDDKFAEEASSELDEEGDWKSVLLSAILEMEPDAFERLAQRILRESGFKTVEVTGQPGDGGIDGTGVLQLNLITFPVAFQCKRYSGSVRSRDIRDFRGAIMGRCEKGLMITTGTITSDAQKEAARDGALAIDLVDGDRLCDLLKELGLGVETELVEEVSIISDWFKKI